MTDAGNLFGHSAKSLSDAQNKPSNLSGHSAKALSDAQNKAGNLSGHSAKSLSGIQKTTDINFLTQILAEATRKGLYYCRKQIHLDGLTFEECAFENCHFYTRTGQFTLKNCRIYGPSTAFFYEGSALKVVKLHELLHSSHNNYIKFPQFFPRVDNDGRFSIE